MGGFRLTAVNMLAIRLARHARRHKGATANGTADCSPCVSLLDGRFRRHVILDGRPAVARLEENRPDCPAKLEEALGSQSLRSDVGKVQAGTDLHQANPDTDEPVVMKHWPILDNVAFQGGKSDDVLMSDTKPTGPEVPELDPKITSGVRVHESPRMAFPARADERITVRQEHAWDFLWWVVLEKVHDLFRPNARLDAVLEALALGLGRRQVYSRDFAVLPS